MAPFDRAVDRLRAKVSFVFTAAQRPSDLQRSISHCVRIGVMVEMVPGDEPTAVLRKLIYAWCDRRCLEALKYVLPAYLLFNGLHEAWSSLYNALRDGSSPRSAG
jgi:hypothetical protein